jgi:molybdopterin molybdotransferase
MALLAVADAQLRIVSLAPRMSSEQVSLRQSLGRIVADDVVASRDLPAFDNSAMDGYAVAARDVPSTLPVIAIIAAGTPTKILPALGPAQAAQIFTGAPMPMGADSVVIVEDAKANGQLVTLPSIAVGENVRLRGEDITVGSIAVTAGSLITPGTIAMLAAQGRASVAVGGRPRVALITTGDELVSVDATLTAGQVVDSSAHMLIAQLQNAGADPTYLGIVPDDQDAVTKAIREALTFDVVITTGGVSAGERDYVRPALAAAGITLDVWKVAMKPGKPFAFGRAENSPTLVFALPGNPVSSLVAFELFVRPALLAMQGARHCYRRKIRVVVPDGYRKPVGRAHYLRARLGDGEGYPVAAIHSKQGSSMLGSVVEFDALVEIPAQVETLAPTETVYAYLV